MQYLVIGTDGKEYGPATPEVLKQWVLEGRLAPTTILRDFASGQALPAAQVAELFPQGAAGAGQPAATQSEAGMFAPDFQKPAPVEAPLPDPDAPRLTAAEEAQQKADKDSSAGVFAASYATAAPPAQSAQDWLAAPSMPGISARQQAALAKSDSGELVWVIVRAIVAIVIFFAFRGSDIVYIVFRAIALVVAIFATVSAIQAHGRGNRYGIAMIATGVVSAVIVAIGWIIRLKTGGGV